MKKLVFCGSRLREFPEEARREAGRQLRNLQKGDDPDDWRPMQSVCPGARDLTSTESYTLRSSLKPYKFFTFLRRRPNRLGKQTSTVPGAHMPKSKPREEKQKHTEPVFEAGSDNIFEDLGFSQDEAANLLVRSDLMSQIKRIIKEKGWTQKRAAEELGVQQPRVSDLFQGHIGEFSVDMLMSWLSKLGYNIEVKLKRKEVA
jgi:predicted XRE-type DNA-binding protein